VEKTYNVSDGLLAVNVPLHDTILVDTDGGKKVKSALVAGVDTVEDQADDNLLPSRTALVPKFGLLQVDDIADVLHDTVQRSRRQDFVFVVVCDGDEQFGVTVVHGRSQIVAIFEGEVIGVASSGRVWQLSAPASGNSAFQCKLTSHVGELLAAALEIIAVLCLDGILDGAGHGVVCAKHGALHKLDLTRHAALESTADAAAGLLSLSPCFGGARLAPGIWRGCAVRGTKLCSRVVVAARG
jgi:hypothetical protein